MIFVGFVIYSDAKQFVPIDTRGETCIVCNVTAERARELQVACWLYPLRAHQPEVSHPFFLW